MAKKKIQAQNKEERKCENCESRFGYLKLKTKEWQCRSCGHCTKLKE